MAVDDEGIRQQAAQAGISVQWADYRGESREVSVESLRLLLDALQPVTSISPSMRVTRCNATTMLAVSATNAGGQVELHDEAGAISYAMVRTVGEQCVLTAPSTPGYYRFEFDEQQLTLAVAPAHNELASTLAQRPAWALAVQLYALRGNRDGGIGGYTQLAELVKSAAAAGAHGVAVSPVHAAFSADAGHYSPYSPSNRLLLNAMYIDADAALPGLLSAEQLAERYLTGNPLDELRRLEQQPLVQWEQAWPLKLQMLRGLWRHFCVASSPAQRQTFRDFVQQGGAVLRNHARFEMLHALQFNADRDKWHWQRWPAALRDVGSSDVEQLAHQFSDEVEFHSFLQWLAATALERAQHVAIDSGMSIGLIADLAVGSSSGGSQAWASPEELLNGLSLGAPPDLINRQGQSWGVTTFSPQSLLSRGYAPFIDMVRAALNYTGGLRIDHILGLQRLWVVPDGCESAQGAYLGYPIAALRDLLSLEAWRHRALIIGEDLGTVPEGFREPLRQCGILGMQVLWFEREHGMFRDPSVWSSQAVAMTSTHDLPTVAGWWLQRDIAWRRQIGDLTGADESAVESAVSERLREREALWNAFVHAGVANGPAPDSSVQAVDAALDFVAKTPAPVVVVPAEDLLGLEQQANLPGTIDQHPNWRRRLPAPFDELVASEDVAARLVRLRQRRPK